MTTALYELQCNIGSISKPDWIFLSYWKMEERYFRQFLTHFYSWPSHKDRGSRELLRIKRIEYEYGKANWEFDGKCHYVPCC